MAVLSSLLKRLLRMGLLLWGVVTVIFLLTEAEKSLWEEYIPFLTKVASLDLGISTRYQPGQAVMSIAWSGFSLSVALVLAALGLSSLFSLALGLRQGQTGPSPGHWAVLILSAAPVFVWGYLVRDLVNPTVAWMARSGLIDSPRPYLVGLGAGPLQYALAALVLALGDGFLANLASTVGEEIHRARRDEHILVAEVNGLSPRRHLARSLLLPLSTSLAARVSLLLGGVIIVETLFSLNGAGRILWRAALVQDRDVLAGVVILFALLVMVVRWGNEALGLLLDPRLRRQA